MLSVHQAKVVAFLADGGMYHTSCMRDEYERVAEIQQEREEHDGNVGWTRPNFWDIWDEVYPEITPISRYELGEWQYHEIESDVDYLMEEGLSAIMDRIVSNDLEHDLIEEILDKILENGDAQYTETDLRDWVSETIAHDTVYCDGCSEEIS